MKAHLAKVSLALLSAAFLLGCQDQASSPVGLDGLGPQFGGPHAVHGSGGDGVTVSLFNSPGVEGIGFTCAGGAKITTTMVGQVTWEKVRRKDSHIHAIVELRGVTSGDYLIFGNQDKLCERTPPIVDFALRPNHATSVTVDGTGDADVRIALTFGSEDRIPAGHAPGSHQLWLTITGPEDLRTSAFGVFLKNHQGH